MSLFDPVLPLDSLSYKRDFIDWADEYVLIEHIDAQPWSDSLRNRRVQHYGYVYDYKSGRADFPTTRIPSWLPNPGFHFNQVIVNEYLPGQGISPHLDADVYGPTIASLSLLSDITMVFDRADEKREMTLERCSLLTMEGSSRYEWRHGIPARLSDNGRKRTRRVSVTYRRLIL